MKTQLNIHRLRIPALLAVLSILVMGITVTGCQDDKLDVPDLKAEVVFIGDTLHIANTTTEDWADVNVLLDDEYAYHIDKIPADAVVDVDITMFENEANIPFPADMRAPKTVLVECDMGQYWGDFSK